MAVSWRITAEGEKQWLGADGCWYSSQELAERADTTSPPPAPTRASPGNAPAFPGIYREQKPKRKVNRKRLAVSLIILAILIGVIAYFSIKSQSPPYKIDMLSVRAISNQQVDVEYRVHNLGSSPWQPSCSVSILPVYGGGIGTAVQSSYGPIDGGQYGDVGGIVTISNNDARAVTTADVTITNC